MKNYAIAAVILFCHALLVETLNIVFVPDAVTIHIDEIITIKYEITRESNGTGDSTSYTCYSRNIKIASLENESVILNSIGSGEFTVIGNFLGKTLISCTDSMTNDTTKRNLNVTVTRKERLIDTIFTVSVATLVSVIYINFGCALDWGELRQILKRPIGPTLGFCGQFIMMPLLSYGFGKLLFPDNPEMQLGMFFTGTSPGGGASNLWTLLLEGNISLSIIMSAVCTIAAFGMMPLWIFTLGKSIFQSSNIEVPYSQIVSYVIALLIPLAIGYLIQRYLNSVAQFLKRIMKAFSTCLIVFIIIFATATNLWLFELFSWQIIVAGMALPWCGYLLGYLLSKLLRQPGPDCTAIAVEIGIQNTGIAIFLLRFSLPQPEADLTAIIPVAIAILTPFPLVFLYLYKKITARFLSLEKKKRVSDATVEVGFEK